MKTHLASNLENDTTKSYFFSPHSAFIPREVHVDAARKKDNLSYFYKPLKRSELRGCGKN